MRRSRPSSSSPSPPSPPSPPSASITTIQDPTQQPPSSSWTPHRLLTSTYKDLGSPSNVTSSFIQHLLTSTKTLTSILSILLSSPNKSGIFDYSLNIDIHDFISLNPILGNMVLYHSETLLPLLEEAIITCQKEIVKRWEEIVSLVQCIPKDDIDIVWSRLMECNPISNALLDYAVSRMEEDDDNNNNNNDDDCQTNNERIKKYYKRPIVKGINGTRIHARLIHLPPHLTNCKPSISSLTSHDIGKILQISGTVVRTSKVQMYESQRAYKCHDKNGCGTSFIIKADLQQWNNALVSPSRCPNPSCKNKEFVCIPEGGCRSDYQEIKLQESLSNMSNHHNSNGSGSGSGGISSIPRTLLIKLQHDLVDQCQPGDDVVVVGTLLSQWQNLVQMGDVQIGMVMDAHSIRVSNGNNSNGMGSGSSSWDCIFNNSRDDDDDDDDDDDKDDIDEGHDNERDDDNNKRRKRRRKLKKGAIREEVIRQFEDFWNEDYNQKRPIAARNFICKAVCPTLYGLSLVKMSLLLALIGGSNDASVHGGSNNSNDDTAYHDEKTMYKTNREHDDNNNESSDDEDELPVQFSLGDDNDFDLEKTEYSPVQSTRRSSEKHRKREDSSNQTIHTRRREQSHLLIVGDPGCGKSQFLKFATALCPRSVLASGSGTTSAGLTCAAVRDDTSKEWTLEAGALVLADRGVCAIDEFSCINPKDRTTIHEAMEQQTLSVAKAGIIAKLNCRATVIAVTNAKSGYYDHDKSFSVNVGIEPPLLSRFDIIFKLIDGSDITKDDNIATFLLNRAISGAGYECTKSSKDQSDIWGIEKLRAYIATVKSCFKPAISNDASMLLEKHYTFCRSSEDMSIQITVRFLESLIRLSQAHASLMYRNVVTVDDAVAIILLMESSVASCTHNSNNSLGSDPAANFPDDNDADIEFLLMKAKVLQKYNMLNCLSEDENAIIEEEEKKQASYDPGLASWDNFESNHHHHHQSNMFTPSGTQSMMFDHYGRFTQKTTPSPSNVSGNDFSNVQGGNSTHNDWTNPPY